MGHMKPKLDTSNKKLTILVFADYYLPGFKAGGPIRTLANMMSQLQDEFHFKIVTRDRDLGDFAKYDQIDTNVWIKNGSCEILYVDAQKFGLLSIYRLLRQTSFDILYLNSFFSYWATIFPLIARVLIGSKTTRLIIAPRGEFSAGALAIGSSKKAIYLRMATFVGLYRHAIWQASSQNESDDITACLKKYGQADHARFQIRIAPDLIPKLGVEKALTSLEKRKSGLSIVFLSRIVAMKNLDFLIDVLSKVKDQISFNIYGPVEDQDYWAMCQEKVKSFSDNVSVAYGGIVEHQEVAARLNESDVFFLPTRGENFGHIIFESLAAGVPAVISDKTSWEPDPNGALTVIPLEVELWVNEIHNWSQRSQEERNILKQKALEYANAYSSKSDAYQQNVDLFRQFNQ